MSHPEPTRSPGSSALEPERRRRPWWLLLLLAAVAIVVLLLLLSRCGDDDTTDSGTDSSSTASASPATPSASLTATTSASATASAPPAPTPTPTTTPPATPPAAPAVGALTSGTASLLPTADAPGVVDLNQYVGQPAQGRGVQVLSVPADEGFWVGTSDADRVWIQLVGDGESPYQVQAGDLVDVEATVVANPAGFARQVGVSRAEGAARLRAAGSHLEADRGAVQLSQS